MPAYTVHLQICDHTPQIDQMAAYFQVEKVDNCLVIPPHLGQGSIQYYALPYQIQVHHYQYQLNQEVNIQGQNPEEGGLFMLQINLSQRLLHKQIGTKEVHLSQAGGSGVLFYSPGHDSFGQNEIGKAYQILFLAFPASTLPLLITPDRQAAIQANHGFCLYDELSPELESQLRQTLTDARTISPIELQAQLMQALARIVEQFANRDHSPSSKLSLQDVARQFAVKELLLSHIYGNAPTLKEIAQEVHISPSKLKADFKALFGQSIYQYYLSKKMEIAKALLSGPKRTVAEVGYELGYTNISQFSAQFKKQVGINPSQYQG